MFDDVLLSVVDSSLLTVSVTLNLLLKHESECKLFALALLAPETWQWIRCSSDLIEKCFYQWLNKSN